MALEGNGKKRNALNVIAILNANFFQVKLFFLLKKNKKS